MGLEPPVISIGYVGANASPATRDSACSSPSADPDDVKAGDSGISLVCLHCLVDDHPEIGRGLDIAREHGVADLDENGEWVAMSGGPRQRP